jgi:hypothetical protein
MNPETKICQNCKKEFVIDTNDFGFYEKIKVPAPTWCPECRMIRRFVFYNLRNLFRRKEDNSGKEIFTGFPAAVPAKIFDVDFWNSDEWDPMEYGRDYDFSRPFFEQFREFLYSVPWPSKDVTNMINSDYCNNAGWDKNCYLVFDTGDSENSAYLVRAFETKDAMDLYEARHAELSYDGYMVDEAYRVFYSVNIEDCVDVWFSRDMIGCQNCFGCTNLRGKSYYIFNQPYSKEDYKEFLSKLDLGSHKTVAELKVKAAELWMQYPVRFALAINTVNSTGEHIERTKNVKQSYSIHESENLSYSQFVEPPASDCWDYSEFGSGASLMYETLDSGIESSRIKFSYMCWQGCHDLEYSAFCRGSSDLFACVSMKKGKYCIFNKQYSKEEYEALKEKIIAHMNEMPYVAQRANGKEQIVYKYGEFFPPEFSPFGYNETVAQDFFPLSETEAKEKGYAWRPIEVREYEMTISAENLPDNIKAVEESILKEIIKCASCGKAYRIIQMEFDFYKRVGVPLPRFCHMCRFNERFKWVNSPKWRHAKCQCAGATDDRKLYTNAMGHTHGADHCPEEFETSYRPDRKEVIYCEQCYKIEVY